MKKRRGTKTFSASSDEGKEKGRKKSPRLISASSKERRPSGKEDSQHAINRWKRKEVRERTLFVFRLLQVVTELMGESAREGHLEEIEESRPPAPTGA